MVFDSGNMEFNVLSMEFDVLSLCWLMISSWRKTYPSHRGIPQTKQYQYDGMRLSGASCKLSPKAMQPFKLPKLWTRSKRKLCESHLGVAPINQLSKLAGSINGEYIPQ